MRIDKICDIVALRRAVLFKELDTSTVNIQLELPFYNGKVLSTTMGLKRIDKDEIITIEFLLEDNILIKIMQKTNKHKVVESFIKLPIVDNKFTTEQQKEICRQLYEKVTSFLRTYYPIDKDQCRIEIE